MPRKEPSTAQIEAQQNDLNGKATLKQEVKEALLKALRDKDASAAAKVSAARTLLEYFSDGESANHSDKRGAELSATELDEEIARSLARR